jgi:hypothetical protein
VTNHCRIGRIEEPSPAIRSRAGVRPAVAAMLGMPRWMDVLLLVVIWSIWASLAREPARLTLRPSTSPCQPSRSASAIRAKEVVADPDDAVALSWVHPQQRASQTAVLVDTAGGIGSATGSEGDASAFEVPEEVLPFLLGGLTVFGGGP